MLRALKLQKLQPQTLLVSPSPYHISPKFSGKRFLQAVDRPQSFGKMDRVPDENLDVGDSLNSLGEQYASRCDEEGFGGMIYGKDKYGSKDEEESTNTIAKSKDEHAKSPGSTEAKEEEKDRNQNKGAA